MIAEEVVTTVDGEVTILTTKKEVIVTTTATGMVDTKGTILNRAVVAAIASGKVIRSRAMTQMDTTRTDASTKMGADGSGVAQTNVTIDHAAATAAEWGVATTTAASTGNRETCGTRSRRHGTAAGAEARSDMKHGY